MFSAHQKIYVYDSATNENIFSQTVDLDAIPSAVSALAQRFNTTEVRIYSNVKFGQAQAEEIQTAYSLLYGKNNLNVEVYQNV